MQTLLYVQSSIFGAEGQSSRLAGEFIEGWRSRHPRGHVLTRDLAAEPAPHLDLARFRSFSTAAEFRTPGQRAVDEYSMKLIEELQAADVLVLAAPMYNFSIPSTLHAWFDHIARAGITFRYTAEGPEGLLKGKKAYVFITRGGLYGEDHSQTAYLRQFLGFIGLTDIEFIHAEGLALTEERDRNLEQAQKATSKLLAA